MAVHDSPARHMPLERRVLRDTVHDQLFRMLVDGSLSPGASLSIDGLARDLCVSPTPVREALVHLEHTGLVRRAALRGYTVADPPTAADLTQLMAARLIVESAALRAAMDPGPAGEGVPGRGAAASETADALSQALRRQRSAYDELARHAAFCPPAQLFAYLAAEWDFHRILVERSANPYLTRMVDVVAAEVHRGRRGDDGRPFDAAESLTEHQAILAAVEAGDGDGAIAALEGHLAALLERARTRLSGQSD